MAAIVAGVFLCFLCVGPKLRAQVTTGNIVGTVVDSSGAAVPNAQVTLTNLGTNNVRTVTTGATGIFRFPTLPAGTYTVAIDAAGFKKFTTTNIQLNASSTRDLGKIALQVGAVTQTVTVTAAATPIETSNSQMSTSLTGSAINALPLRGRDFLGAIDLTPGVVDTTVNRVAGKGSFSRITINGAGTVGDSSAINFTVDGITSVDTGCQCTPHYEPNMASVAEVKVLTSNYDAEYGRTSGGTIEVITKGGTSDFHGQGWWDHRHEQFNANDYFNKQAGRSRSKYRYNIEGFAVGGPIPIPEYNPWSNRKKLFFFVSQEFQGRVSPNSINYLNLPTSDILGTSDTDKACDCINLGGTVTDANTMYDASGNPLGMDVIDPLTGSAFPVNGISGQPAIPMSRASSVGIAMMGIFPAPLFDQSACPSGGGGAFNCNYLSSASDRHPYRTWNMRIDWQPTSKLTSFFRWDKSYDHTFSNYRYTNFPGYPVDHDNSGHGYAASFTYVASPTVINEFTAGYDWNSWAWPVAQSLLDSLAPTNYGNPPLLVPIPPNTYGVNELNWVLPALWYGNDLPNMGRWLSSPAGGAGTNAATSAPYTAGTSLFNYFNSNPIYQASDNLSIVKGTHQFKMGIYIAYTGKIQPSNNAAFMGSYSFGTDTTNPLNSGNGYVNGVLGYYDQFIQNSVRGYFNDKYWNVEPYVQDSWRATKRLTLDYGVRIYYHPAQYDGYKGIYSYFNPSLYDPTKAPRIFSPACSVALQTNMNCKDSGGVLQSSDPTFLNANGTSSNPQPSAYIGAYVPGTGDIANGMVLAPAGTPTYGWTFPIAAAPRVGFAVDVFGNGKTAVRGGFGIYYSRYDGNQAWFEAGQPPTSYTYSSSNGTIAGLENITGVISPANINSELSGLVPWPRAYNGSLNVQQDLGFNTAMSAAYVFNFGRTLNLTDNINPVPLGANFQQSNIDPVTGTALTENSSVRERVTYPGYGDIFTLNNFGESNYHSLQLSLQHRMTGGLLFGVAYTWSHATSLTGWDSLLTRAANYARNYGSAPSDRRQTLQVNWSYELPNLSGSLSSSMMGKVLGAVVDNWTYAGHYQAQSGGPLSVSFSDPSTDYTGSASIGARADVVCNPMSNVPAGYAFNPACYVAPAAPINGVASLGNQGIYSARSFGLNNWDMTLSKFVPIGLGESRGFNLQFQAYNVFNHTQFNTGIRTSGHFSGPGTSSTGSIGKPSSDSLGPRVIAFELKFMF